MRDMSAWTLGSIGGFSNASSKLLARALRSQPAHRSLTTTLFQCVLVLCNKSVPPLFWNVCIEFNKSVPPLFHNVFTEFDKSVPPLFQDVLIEFK